MSVRSNMFLVSLIAFQTLYCSECKTPLLGALKRQHRYGTDAIDANSAEADRQKIIQDIVEKMHALEVELKTVRSELDEVRLQIDFLPKK